MGIAQDIRENAPALRFCWRAVDTQRRALATYTALAVAGTLFSSILPLLAKWETDQLVGKRLDFLGFPLGDPFFVFSAILGATLAATFLSSGMDRLADIVRNRYQDLVQNELHLALFRRLDHIDLGLYLNRRNVAMIGEAMETRDTVGSIDQAFQAFVLRPLGMVGVFAAFAAVSPWVLAVVMASALVSRALDNVRASFSKRYEMDSNWKRQSQLYPVQNEIESRYHRLAVNGGDESVLSVYSSTQRDLSDFAYRASRREAVMGAVGNLLSQASSLLIKLGAGWAVFAGTGSVGTVVMAVMFADRVETFLTGILSMRREWLEFDFSFRRVGLFLKFTEPRPQKTLRPEGISIRARGLAFSYPNVSPEVVAYAGMLDAHVKRLSQVGYGTDYASRNLDVLREANEAAAHPRVPVLRGVDLDLAAGRVVGLVGKNGAGKSTLIHLLLGMFADYGGSLEVGGAQVSHVRRDEMSRLVSVVEQDPYIIRGLSIRENALLGVRRQVPDAELLGLLAKFGLSRALKETPKGLDSKMGWEADLSGGQCQILALVRVILQDRPILILDEGTGQLDAEHELVAMEELLGRRKDKAVLFVTHRMSTMRHADVIHCLEDGRITKSGGHAELLAHGDNPYARFWRAQVGSVV